MFYLLRGMGDYRKDLNERKVQGLGSTASWNVHRGSGRECLWRLAVQLLRSCCGSLCCASSKGHRGPEAKEGERAEEPDCRCCRAVQGCLDGFPLLTCGRHHHRRRCHRRRRRWKGVGRGESGGREEKHRHHRSRRRRRHHRRRRYQPHASP